MDWQKIRSLNEEIFSKTKIILRKCESWIRFELNWTEFAKRTDLAYLKSAIDKLGFDKLVPAPVDLSKLSV